MGVHSGKRTWVMLEVTVRSKAMIRIGNANKASH